jgi:hypothetical protein
MGLIAGDHGRDGYWSAVVDTQHSLLGFADNADDPQSASIRKLTANESFLDTLNAAKQQLYGGKSSAVRYNTLNDCGEQHQGAARRGHTRYTPADGSHCRA